MTPPRHLLATAAAATISLLTLSACGENSIYTSGDATGTETTTITQSTSRTSDRYDYHSSTKYNGNHSTERDSYRRSYRDRDGENYEVTPRSIQRTRTSVAPTTTTLTTTQVRPAPPDGQSDSQIYHSSAEWGWLSYPGRVIPGGLMINITQSTQCSVGWIVGREQRRFILTAGHCGNIRDQFAISDQAGNRAIIGEMVESTFIKARGADYGLIELYSMKYVDAKPPFKETLKGWRNTAWLDKQRTRVCHLGYRNSQSCGAYLGYNQTGIFQFRGYVDSGDSGGPVYTLINNELYAVGIISYRQPADATRVSAQDIGPAMERWGLTIYRS